MREFRRPVVPFMSLREVPGHMFVATVVALSAVAARGDTIVFRQGLNGYAGVVDLSIREGLPDTPTDGVNRIEWDGDDPSGTRQSNHALIRFEGVFGAGPNQVPEGAVITQAFLQFEVNNEGNPGLMREVATDWGAGTTFNTFGGVPGVQAGDVGAVVGEMSGTIGARVISVAPSLTSWSVDPSSNRGWIISPAGGNGVEMRSSEYSTAEVRPTLVVTYDEGARLPLLARSPYLQMGTPTSMVVAWRTDFPTTSRVRYGLSPDNLSSTAALMDESVDHAVPISGLTPGTRYYYDVGTQDVVLAGGDADHFFVTSPPTGSAAAFSIWVVGDSGTAGAAQLAVRDAMLADTSGSPPDLFVHLGDMAYLNGETTEFTDRFFGPYASVLKNTVTWTTIGNHEGHASSSAGETGPYYEAYVLPRSGEAGGLASGTEAYYSFDHANVHFICLDSYHSDRSPGSAMLTWLEDDLAATDADWLIAFWHHPPYSKGTHDSDDPDDSGGSLVDMRVNVLPILEAAGVDLVLAGHSHIYERSFLVDGAYDTPTTAAGHIVDGGDGRPSGDGAYGKPAGLAGHAGAVYVVAGHGGANVGGSADHPLMYFSELANGSCVLEIDGQSLSMRNIRDDGVVSDTFSIVKATGGASVPAVSAWGVGVMVLLLAVAATRVWSLRGGSGSVDANV